MAELNSSFKRSENKLSVTLQNSAFLDGDQHVGRVTRNTVSLENLIAEIIEKNSGVDPYTIQHAAVLLRHEMLMTLQRGKGVNMLGLGTLYLGLTSTVKGMNPSPTDIPDLEIRFTPSAIANKALENIVIDKVVFTEAKPKIDTFTDLWTGKNDCLTPCRTCKITGNLLKLGKENSFIQFIAVDKNGKEVAGEKPLMIGLDKLNKNTQKELIFFIPDELVKGKSYKIRIMTSYLTNTTSRKIPVASETAGYLVG